MYLSRTNTALCRDLIVHMEISLFFSFLAAATWERSGKLHCVFSCRITPCGNTISPAHQPKGAGVMVTVTVATSTRILIISAHQEDALSSALPTVLPIGTALWVLFALSVLWLCPGLADVHTECCLPGSLLSVHSTYRPWTPTGLVWILSLLMPLWPQTMMCPRWASVSWSVNMG